MRAHATQPSMPTLMRITLSVSLAVSKASASQCCQSIASAPWALLCGETELVGGQDATAFQARVRKAMQDIPYGQTRTYGELAHSAGGAPRAVGQACGANMLPLIVPCHRVVASTGLGGYSGGKGLDTKRLLLALESDAIAG